MLKGISVQHVYRQRVNGTGGPRVVAGHAPVVAGGGQSAADGLIGAALGAGGRIAETLARDWRAEQTARVEDALLAVDRQFELWKADYRQTRQGADAADAARDFATHYEELSRQAIAGFGHGNEIFQDALRRRLAGHGLLALRDGSQYQARQVERWKTSQLEGQMASFARLVDDCPEDGEAIEFERNQILASHALKNPGLDQRAFADRLDSLAFRGRMRAMLADPARLGDAEALLGQAMASRESGQTWAPDPTGRTGPRPGSASERALAGHNYGFVKDGSGKFRQFASRADGLAAIGERFIRYSSAPQKGWNASTLAEAMAIYAPASDGNRLEPYLAHLEQLTGIGRNEKINFKDPEILARIIAAIPRHEHGDFARISPEEALAAARQAIGGRRPAGAGATAAELAGYGAEIARRKADMAHNEDIAEVGRLLDLSAGLAIETRVADFYERLAAIPDASRRSRLEAAGLAQLKFARSREKAKVAAEAADLVARVQGLNPLEARTIINSSGASARARDIAARSLTKPVENAESRAWTDRGLALVDNDRLQSPEEREAYILEHNLPPALASRLREYRGKLANVSRDRIIELMLANGWNGKGYQLPLDMLELIEKRLPDGRQPTRKELEQAIAALCLKGELDGDSAYMFEAMRIGRLPDWLPEVKKHERQTLDTYLGSMNRSTTYKNRQLLKRQMHHIAPMPDDAGE